MSLVTDVVHFLLQGKPVYRSMRKTEEKADPPIHQKEGISESFLYVFWRAYDGGGIGNAPVCRHRLPGPHRANLIGSIVTDGENEIELRSLWLREFIPTLASKTASRNVCDLKLAQRLRTHLAGWMAPRTISRELRSPLKVHDPVSHDRPRRVACA